MTKYFLATPFLLQGVMMLASCSGGDDPVQIPEEAITLSADGLAVEIAENPEAGALLGTIAVTTNSEETPAYSVIVEDPAGAMAVSSGGEVSVADSALFDFELRQELTLNVRVAVEGLADTVAVTVTLTDLDDTLNPVAHYKLDGNTDDATENGHHASLWGELVLDTDRKGNANSAANFSSLNNFIYVEAASVLPAAVDQPGEQPDASFTIAMWVKLLGSSTSEQTFCTHRADDNTIGFWHRIRRLRSETFNDGSQEMWFDEANRPRTTVQFVEDQWVHVAVVYDEAAGEARLYEDGVEMRSQSVIYTMDTGGALIFGNMSEYIGGTISGGLSNPFDGLMDDIMVFDQALTAAEVATLAAD